MTKSPNGNDRDDTADDATAESDLPVRPPDVQGRRGDDAVRSDGGDPTDVLDRVRGGGRESDAHLWGKLALHARRQQRRAPWLYGAYEFERTVSDWVADCLVTSPTPHRTTGDRAWIEFVVNSDQKYRAKTRAALRFGYPIYWVLHADAPEARHAARTAILSEDDAAAEFSFGTFDPATNTLDLGDAVTFDQHRIPINSLDAFRVSDVLGYRRGAAHIPRIKDRWWCDLGWVRINDDPYRVHVRSDDEVVQLLPPAGPLGTTRELDLNDNDSWLARRIADGNVERIGPIPPTSTYERRSYANLPPRRE